MEAMAADFESFLSPQEKADRGLLVQFYIGTRKNEVKTADAGRAIFDEIEYVKISVPGQRDALFEGPAKEDHLKRFSRQYKAFKEGQELAQTGTPIEHWPLMTKGMVEEYKHLRINTVEQIADLSEAVIGKVGIGARDLQKKAKAWLASAAGTADSQRFATENDELKADVKELQKKVAELMAENKTLSKNLKRSE